MPCKCRVVAKVSIMDESFIRFDKIALKNLTQLTGLVCSGRVREARISVIWFAFV